MSEGNYMKLKKGVNKFRVLSSAIVGYEYWTKDKKPVRQKEAWEEVPDDAKRNENGSFQKFFWAFIVWNYEAKKVQILEITQKTVQEGIEALVEDESWGHPSKYDIVVTGTGDDLERRYTVTPKPHSPAPEADISQINLKALYEGADPFANN